MQKVEIRKTRFNGKEMDVLNVIETHFQKRMVDKVKHQIPDHTLDKESRSQFPDYFICYNVGDSGNCPLFHDEKGFKDICSQKVFDETGRENGKEKENNFRGKWLIFHDTLLKF